MSRIKRELHKYRHAWPLLYVFIYMPWFIILENQIIPEYKGLHIIHCAIDDFIPFCEYFIIPYLLWFLYVPAVFLFLFYHSKNEFYRICAYEFTGMTIALLICTLYPNGLNLRITDLKQDNPFISLVQFLWDSDTPTNVLPSIHVFATISTHICLVKSPHMKGFRPRRHIRRLSLVLCILICMSTVFLKQHSVIDAACGAILAFVLYFIVFHWWFKNTKFPPPVVRNPQQHQVLFFLNKNNKKDDNIKAGASKV